MARLTSGWFGSALSSSQALTTAAWSWAASRFGSYCGCEIIARIAPVFGSSATTAPRWLPRPLSAASCALGLTVVWMVAPTGCFPVRRSVTRV